MTHTNTLVLQMKTDSTPTTWSPPTLITYQIATQPSQEYLLLPPKSTDNQQFLSRNLTGTSLAFSGQCLGLVEQSLDPKSKRDLLVVCVHPARPESLSKDQNNFSLSTQSQLYSSSFFLCLLFFCCFFFRFIIISYNVLFHYHNHLFC